MRSTVKKHFVIAQEADIALIVRVKSNQPTLHHLMANIVATTLPLSVHHSQHKARGRDESRTVQIFIPVGQFDRTDWKDAMRLSVLSDWGCSWSRCG